MKIILRGETKNYDKHRTLIFTAHVPNILEWLFLFKRMKLINYVGAGSKWRQLHVNGQVQLHDVTDSKIIHQLQGWYNGEQFYQRNKNVSKTLILALACMLMSCHSLLFNDSEVFTQVGYGYDSTFTRSLDKILFPVCTMQFQEPGCMDAVVITTRISKFNVSILSFYLVVDKHKIEIPRMEMNPGHAEYNGIGVDGKPYTVKYFITREETRIHVLCPDGHTLFVSSKCNRC